MASMLAISMALGLALAAPQAGPVVVERVVAVVRNPSGSAPRPLTLTRLTEEARVALVSQGATEAAFAPLDAAALRASLRWLLDQQLVADDAARLKLDEPPLDQVEAELARFKERLGGGAATARFLSSCELTEDELAGILARGLKVRRYLDGRLSRGVRVSDDDVARQLAATGRFTASPEERDAIRARLSAERTQAQVKQLLADLRARADIRILVPELREDPAP
jgi:hypothetical protein